MIKNRAASAAAVVGLVSAGALINAAPAEAYTYDQNIWNSCSSHGPNTYPPPGTLTVEEYDGGTNTHIAPCTWHRTNYIKKRIYVHSGEEIKILDDDSSRTAIKDATGWHPFPWWAIDQGSTNGSSITVYSYKD